MYETAEKLKQFASPNPSRWRENAEARLAYKESSSQGTQGSIKYA